MDSRKERSIARAKSKENEDLRQESTEFRTGYYSGRVLAVVLALLQWLAPTALVILLMWLIPEAFSGLSGQNGALVAVGITIAVMWSTNWGGSWVDNHKRLFAKVKQFRS